MILTQRNNAMDVIDVKHTFITKQVVYGNAIELLNSYTYRQLEYRQ